MKKSTKRWIIAVPAVVCLVAIFWILGTCGSGKLLQTKKAMMFASTPVFETEEVSYEVEAGLEVFDTEYLQVSVAAATPWGVLLRFHIPVEMEAKWFEGEDDTEAQEITLGPATKWRFLPPGQTLKMYGGLAGWTGEGATLFLFYCKNDTDSDF